MTTRMLFLAAILGFTTGLSAVQRNEKKTGDIRVQRIEGERFYLMPEKVFNVAMSMKSMAVRSLKMVEKRDGFFLVKMSPLLLDQLSQKIHHDLGTCGGFFDVTEEKKKSFLVPLDFKKFAPMPSQSIVDSFSGKSIQYKNVILENMKNINRSRFTNTWQQFIQFPNRSARSNHGKKASEWLQNKVNDFLKASNRSDISMEVIPTGRRYIQDSVVVKIPGVGGQKEGGVLMGGHMDTLSWGDMPGADDDASGTISTFEVLRAIVDSGLKFKNDLYFAFYAAEEVGLVGSGVVSDLFKKRGVELQAVFHLDMTGYNSSRDEEEIFFLTDYTTTSLTSWTKKLATEILGINSNKIGDTSCGYACSDHANWNRKGYQTVYPFEASFRNYNRAIHSQRDTMARLDLDHAMKFVKLGFAFMVELGRVNL